MKRWLAVMLAVLLTLATAVVAYADENAPDQEPEAIITAQEISFDTTTTNWTDFSYIGFHIWEVAGDVGFQAFDWGAKKERGADADNDGIWTYNFTDKGLTLRDGAQYGVIFYNSRGSQTYNLLFDTTCLDDTAYCDLTTVYENPEDSSKTAVPAFWRNQDPTVNGPELCVTSIGNVTGTCVPRGITRAGLLNGFLENTLANAREFSGLSDQALIDNLGENLGLTKNEVKQAIESSDKAVEWNDADSTLSGGVAPYKVDVQVVSGKGAVACSEQGYYTYQWLTLTAEPEAGYAFSGWEIEGEYVLANEETLSDPAVTITVRSDLVVKANFAPKSAQGQLGDADMDQLVTIMDATRIQRYIAKLVTEDEIDLNAADTDGDGKVSVMDATRIQRVLAGLCGWDGAAIITDNRDEDPKAVEPTTIEYKEPVAE